MTRKRILLADDIELFLELEKTFFRREEFDLLTARTGVEALALIREYRPALVFMDLHMPEMDGDACTFAIKSDPELKHIPVIMVTGMGRQEDIDRCRIAGCDDILLKPINRHVFTETAQKYLQVMDRLAPRVLARLRVSYGMEGEEVLSDYTINISAGGLFLESNNPLPPETPLSLQFKLPNRDQVIRCQGRVAWINGFENPKKPTLPPGMGLQLIDLGLDDMHAIRDFIKEECLTPSW